VQLLRQRHFWAFHTNTRFHLKPAVVLRQLAERLEHRDRKLYLDGEIRQWYSKGDGRGVIFILGAKTVDEAHAIRDTLPLSKENLMDYVYIPIGPLPPDG
jgi:hypothetical protein